MSKGSAGSASGTPRQAASRLREALRRVATPVAGRPPKRAVRARRSTPAWAVLAELHDAATARGGPGTFLRVAGRARGSVALAWWDDAGRGDQAELPGGAFELLLRPPPGTAAPRLTVRAGPRGGAARVKLDAIESWAPRPGPDGFAALWRPPRLRPCPGWTRFYGDAPADAGPARLRDALWTQRPAGRDAELVWFDGIPLRLPGHGSSARALAQSGLYEPLTLCVLRAVLPTGGTLVDVGANVGFFSRAAARWAGPGGRVLAVEPSARERADLQRVLGNFGDADAALSVHPVALGAAAGRATLRLADAANAGLNTLAPAFAYDAVPTVETAEVRVTTLDALVRDADVARVDVVKIDVEGLEGDVLAGAAETLATHRPVLLVEVNAPALGHAGASVAELEATLRDAGCSLWVLDEDEAAARPVGNLPADASVNVAAVPAERSAWFGERLRGLPAAGPPREVTGTPP